MSIFRRRRDKRPTAGTSPTPAASPSTATRFDPTVYDTGSSYSGGHGSSGCSSSSTSSTPYDSGSSSSCDGGGY